MPSEGNDWDSCGMIFVIICYFDKGDNNGIPNIFEDRKSTMKRDLTWWLSVWKYYTDSI